MEVRLAASCLSLTSSVPISTSFWVPGSEIGVQIQLAVARLSERGGQHLFHGSPIGGELPFVDQLRADFDFVLGSRVREALYTDFSLDLARAGEGAADLLQRRFLGEFDGHQGAALEIDPELQPALHQDTDTAGHREHQRSNNERPFLAEKIKIRVLK